MEKPLRVKRNGLESWLPTKPAALTWAEGVVGEDFVGELQPPTRITTEEKR